MTDPGLGEIEANTSRRVGEAIRWAREKRGWRQTDLAEATGFPQGTVSKWERAALTPTICELVWLERRLDLTAGMLFVAAGLVPDQPSVVLAVTGDPELAEPERDFVLKAYWAALLVSRSEVEVPGGEVKRAGGKRRRKRGR